MSSSTGFGTGSFGDSPIGSIPFGDVKGIIDNILIATGHSNPASETTKRAQVLIYMNLRYQQVCSDSKWRWMQAKYDFNLQAPYSDGTATALNGSPLVTGIATQWNATLSPSNIFWFKKDSAVYHVSSVDSQTSLNLESKFSEDTITVDDEGNGAAYVSACNQYKLPVEVDQLKTIVVDGDTKVELIGPDDLSLYQSRNPQALGRPRFATISRRDTDDDATYVEFWPSPDRTYQTELGYSVRIFSLEDSDDCYPIIPDRFRAILFYGACADFATVTLKNPTVGDKMASMFNSMYGQMKASRELTDQTLRVQPGRDYVRRATRGKFQGRGFWGVDAYGKVED
jgi:hypothetical protein